MNKYNKIFEKVYTEQQHKFNEFIIKFKAYIHNNSKAREISFKYFKGEEISDDDMKFFKHQILDVMKSVGIGIPTILLPFGVLLPSFVMYISKKLDIDILPSFLKEDNEIDKLN